LAGWPR
jgi:pyridoxamine 5'-phosphate oxidase family protein